MSDGEICYNLFAIILLICILYPTKEFVTTGLTIEYLFRNVFGSEDIEFVQYHINRTCYTILLHSILPLIYVLLYYFQFTIEFQIDSSLEYIKYIIWNCFVTLSILLPIISCSFIKFYWKWHLNHQIMKILKCYSNNGNNCKLIVNDINTEFRNENKFIYQINAITKVIVTENWIINIKPYTVYFAHQSDTALIAVKSDSHSFSQDSVEPIQYVNINVKPTRNGTSEFVIRLNALEFKDLQDRLIRPITILSGVTFNKSEIERFIEVFKEQISLNEKFKIAQISDLCFACTQNEPNIKLNKQCFDHNENNEIIDGNVGCGNCYCRPMWCVDCMAKWFASRQMEYDKDVWLEQKCTCPMCRVKFCILDVCYIEKISEQ